MRLILLTMFTLIAFAANSVLVRSALASESIGPAAFGAVRLASGGGMLLVLTLITRERRALFPSGSAVSSAALLVYVVGFSYAYLWLDTGTGALILFGGVQVTMFAGALMAGEKMPRTKWIGAGLAMLGLALLFGPKAGRPDVFGAALMVVAAVGWGVYSLRGRGVKRPLAASASTFLLATPLATGLWLVVPDGVSISPQGVGLAIASGAIASGLGYALWYTVLPQLRSSTAAVLQLSVPIIALAGGMLLLSEPLTWSFALAAPLIIIGVLVAIRR
ncbi:MAG: EamA family transporter [Rhodobacteraceae bacterium]|nr:EamA family transporter [Paracoccaceae bacterium]